MGLPYTQGCPGNVWVKGCLITLWQQLWHSWLQWTSKAVLKGGKTCPQSIASWGINMERSKDSSPRLPETIHGSDYGLLCISDPHIFLTSGPAVSLLSHPATASSLSPISLPFQPTPALVSHCWAARGSVCSIRVTPKWIYGWANMCERVWSLFWPVRTMDSEINKKFVPFFLLAKFRKYFECLQYSRSWARCYLGKQACIQGGYI